MQLTTKHPSQMTSSEIKASRKLRLKYGTILNWLRESKHRKSTRVCFLKISNRIVGWGLLFTDHCARYRPTVHLFVERRHRRKGLGTAILKRLQRFYPSRKIAVAPWDDTACKFYGRKDIRRGVIFDRTYWYNWH